MSFSQPKHKATYRDSYNTDQRTQNVKSNPAPRNDNPKAYSNKEYKEYRGPTTHARDPKQQNFDNTLGKFLLRREVISLP